MPDITGVSVTLFNPIRGCFFHYDLFPRLHRGLITLNTYGVWKCSLTGDYNLGCNKTWNFTEETLWDSYNIEHLFLV